MNKKYKAIITNKNIYVELELQPKTESVKFGTEVGCNVRLHKDLFFEEFWILFTNYNGSWKISCSDNLYFYVGDVRKLTNKLLMNGDIIHVRYQASNVTVFSLEFVLDFNYNQRKYQRALNIKSFASLSIGSHTSDQIVLGSPYTQDDEISLIRNDKGYELKIIRTTYGVYHNGSKIIEKALIKNLDFFSLADFVFYYKDGLLWTEIREDLQINGLSYYDCADMKQYPRFIRNTREKLTINTEKIEILDPPTRPEKPKNNLIMSLLPSMGMIFTSIIMAAMGDSMIAYSLISGGMAIVMAIATIIQNNFDYKKEIKERVEKYRAYELKKRKEIIECRNQERELLKTLYIDNKQEEMLLTSFSSDLFDRMSEDEDFLDVRLGIGTVKALRKVAYKKQEKLEIEDELQLIPQQIADEYLMLEDVPVICHLKDANAIGIIGMEEYRFTLMKNMIIDLCARQYPTDISLFFVAAPEHANKVMWLRFLPHVNNENVGFRCIACDDDGKNRIFDTLYKTLSQREKEKPAEHIIVFFYDECGFQTHPVSKFLMQAKDYHATFIFMADQKADIPMGCTSHIYVDSVSSGRLVDTGNKQNVEVFQYEKMDDYVAQQMVQILAPVFTEEISLERSLTKSITLFELLGILTVNDLNLKTRWEKSKVYQSMAVPIGVTRNDVMYLDLHDKAHGAHGLVAGTTGSGKSELLQTYILSVATHFHPYEVGFVIIDFKGGGMANQFKNLPHLLGAITNIDGKEINRSLRFIKAELQKRQRLFAENRVNHIDKYIQKYKTGEAKTPLPHLILIVDEFAELKAEQPDFMQELISAARIGRSLGVHLILATQKPAGQVDDQIWGNSRFKLCLKVQDQEDSNEVLKSPLAAEIKEAGRAYMQVGNNEIFELFQSAYSGAPERLADNTTKEFSIYEVTQSGYRKPLFIQKRDKSGDSERTQLEAMVDYIRSYFQNSGQQQLQGICLPPLSSMIDYPQNIENKEQVEIGIFDDPDNQLQAPVYLDFDNKHTLILGSSQYGKTNLLMSVIRTISSIRSPKQSAFYVLDFGSMILKNFEELNHVGGIVTSTEDEKLKNLLKLLFEEVATRKEKMLSVGVGSFSSYLEAGHTDLPHIYIIIDNLTAAMELYFEEDDSLLTILREGLSVGISVIVTNSQTAGISYRYLSNFANKITFYCNDSSEYMNLFEHDTIHPDEVPGRCIIELEKRILECQTYLAFSGKKENDRVCEMKKFTAKLNERNSGVKVRQIPNIPSILSEKEMEQNYHVMADCYKIPIGLTYNDVAPFWMNIAQLGLMGLCGTKVENRIKFIRYMMKSLENLREKYPVYAVVIDDVSRELMEFKNSKIVRQYTLDISIINELIQSWHSLLEERYQNFIEQGNMGENNELLLLIINNNDVAKRIDGDIDLTELFEEIVSRYRNLNIAIIFSNYENVSVSYDAPLPVTKIKEERHLLFFDDLDNLKPFDVPYEELKANRKRVGDGDVYYIKDSNFIKIKLVTCKEI